MIPRTFSLLLAGLSCSLALSLAQDTNPSTASKDISLFDGKTLGKWEPIRFGGEGSVTVEDGCMVLEEGAILTGVKWTGELPARVNYEIELEAMKILGDDFLLCLTIPVKDSHCSFVCGGWGGGVVGISSIDGLDASENETATFDYFEPNKWYKFRVRVEPNRIQCWIGDNRVVDVDITGAKISMRPGDVELCEPLGMATFQTAAKYRDIKWRNLPQEP